MIFQKNKMEHTNIIGDTAKNRRIDYDLIDRLNKECEAKARKQELEGRLAGKKKKKEEPAAEPTQAHNITYIKTLDELREIKGNYLLQKGIYTIDFEIIVPQGNALTLQPGVELYFTKDAGITCEGKFEARGEDGLEVLLTAKDKDKGWKNLYLKGEAEAVLDYAKFSYGKGRKDKDGGISGGAVLLEAENHLRQNLIINNSYFENNSTTWGGAICTYHGNITIEKKNRFKYNSADHGGIIYNYKGNIAIEENNRFENNSATWGGAIRNNNGTLDIDKSKNTFIGNTPRDIYEE